MSSQAVSRFHNIHVDEAEPPLQPRPCTNCEAPGALVYCPQCGEKQPDHHDYSVAHFFGHTFHELFHIDAKVLTTLRLLVTQPGALTVEYFAGRKTRYVAPLRLFLIMFAIFFVAYTTNKRTAMYSLTTIAQHDSKNSVNVLLDKVAAKKHVSREVAAEEIDHRWQHAISLLQLGNILFVGLVLAVVTAGSGRHLVEHFVFAAHYLSFTYLFAIVTWPLRYYIGFGPGLANKIMIGVSLAIALTYVYLAMKRYYKTGFFSALFAYAGFYVFTVLMMVGPFIFAIVETAASAR